MHSPVALALGALALFMLALPPATYADPPSHAPAHGWRKKHDPYYLGYTGQKWPKDYGVLGGQCDHTAIGAALGGAVGAAVGSQIGEGDGRTVAIIVGGALGAMLGAKIAQDMDAADRACIGHALELAPDGRPVVWTNTQAGVQYMVTPTRGFTQDGRECREFTTERNVGGKKSKSAGKACRVQDGEWRIL
jgi:surface antigen